MAAKIYKNYFDVVILPQKEVQDYAISLSKQLYLLYYLRQRRGKRT